MGDSNHRALDDADYEYEVYLEDDAGNTSAPTKDSVEIDTGLILTGGLDPACDTGPSSTDGITKINNLLFSGKSDPDATVTLYFVSSGESIDTAQPIVARNDNGDWSVDSTTEGYGVLAGLEEGTYSYKVVAEDEAGNKVEMVKTVTVDMTAPTLGEPELLSDSGVADDKITNIIAPRLGGQVEPGVSVTVSVSGESGEVFSGEAVVTSDGNWSIVLPDLPGNGDYSYSVTATDLAGNETQESNTFEIDITGAFNGDGKNEILFSGDSDSYINNLEKTEVTLDAKVEPGSQITSITISSENGGNHTVGKSAISVASDGKVTILEQDISSLSDGLLTVTMNVIDPAANPGVVSHTSVLDTIAPFTGDGTNTITFVGNDIINAQEQKDIALTGSVESGSVVHSVTITDSSVPANEVVVALSDISVSDTGVISIRPQNLETLEDGQLTVSMSVSDPAGNVGAIGYQATLDTSADADNDPLTVTIDPDDLVTNKSEASDVKVSLSGVDADVQSVVVTLTDSKNKPFNFTATKNEFNEWVLNEINVTLLNDGEVSVSALVTDAAGNSAEANSTFTLDKTADVGEDLAVNVSDELKIVDQKEVSNVSVDLSGVDDDVVSVQVIYRDLDGNTVETTVTERDEDGDFIVPGLSLSSLTDGAITVEAIVTDAAGNSKVVTNSLDLDTKIDEFNDFNVIVDSDDELTNREESDNVKVRLEGVDDDVEIVIVTFKDQSNNTKQYTITETDEQGNWIVPDADLTGLVDGTIHVAAKMIDDASNAKTVFDELVLDTTADMGDDFSLSVVDGFEVTNAEEAENVRLSLNGIDDDADNVVVVFRDESDNTVNVTVNSPSAGPLDLNNINITGLTDGNITISATLTDIAGNTVTEESTLVLDTSADADDQALVLSIPLGDQLTNDEEAGHVVAELKGIDADIETVTLTYTDSDGNNVVLADIQTSGKNLTFSPSDLADLADGNIDVTAIVTDDAGNTKEVTTSLEKDTTADADSNFSISVKDDYRLSNLLEAESVEFELAGIDEDIQSVVVTLLGPDNKSAPVQVEKKGDSWVINTANISAFPDGEVTVRAVVTDDAGNTAISTDTFELDKSAMALQLEIAPDINTDGYINAEEIGDRTQVEIKIALPSDAKENDTLTVNNQQFTLSATDISKGIYTHLVNLPAEGERLSVTAFITDEAQNTSVHVTAKAIVDTQADVDGNLELLINSDLQVVNAKEAETMSVDLVGIDNDAASVQIVYSDGFKDVVASASKGGSGWVIPAKNISELNDGNISVKAIITDNAGNTIEKITNIDLDTSADLGTPLSMSYSSTDKIINKQEANGFDVKFNGVDSDIKTLVVTFTDKDSNVKSLHALKTSDGVWTVSDASMDGLADGNVAVKAVITDDAGNTVTLEDTLDLDTTLDENDLLTLTLRDNVINDSEKSDVSVELNGLESDITTVTVTFTDIDGNTQTVTAEGGAALPAADLSGLVDGTVTVSAVVTDDAGNSK
ncbi:Ig-like domain-containing protein, partial [Veronia nyctiphanis]|uniref:Ig-like domain-containing protein n=1 Tax=Veronia nyctiphanis TaxID=1278244 RepID=UPI00191C6076